MADPSLNPAELIQSEGEHLTARLAEVARQAVADALDAGELPTVESVVAALESVAATLAPALAAAVAAELPKIATTAIERAEVEIADAREESGNPYPEVEPPEPGDFTGWSATVAAALIASLTSVAKDAQTPEAATAAVLDTVVSDAPRHIDVMAETAAARTINDSREAAFKANRDIVKKLHYTAVRDEKTSEACKHLDGVDFNIWARNIPRPPIHNGCRSFLKPVTGIKRKAGATQKEIDRQNWAIFRRLEREAKTASRADVEALELRFADLDGTGTFRGVASAYGVLDAHGTEFRAGAFADSLAERRTSGQRIPILLHHDPKRVAGVVTDITDTAQGLLIEGRFVTDTADGREGYALAKSGGMALSVGFKRLADIPRHGGGRTITKANLAEVSLVAVASNPRTKILEVRAQAAPDADHHPHGDTCMPTKTAIASESGATETRDDPNAEIRSAIDAVNRRLDKIEARSSRTGLGAGNDNAADDLEQRAFTGFLRSGREAMGADEIRSLRVSDDTAGGYLAPPQFVAEIDKNLALFSPVRSVATVRNTSSGEVTALKRTSPAVATWVGEEEDRPETDIGYGAQNFSVAELATHVDVSNKLLDDASVDVAAELALEFAEAFGGAEATAFVNGNGVKKPTGFMTDSDVGFTLSGHASQVTADGVIDLYHAVKPAYRQNGVWMANSTTLATLRKLKDPATGTYLLITGGIGNAPSTTILGRPVIEAPDMPDVGAGNFPLAFGDFGLGYTIWDRIALSIVRDPFTQATKGRTRFHGRRRVAAGVRRAEAIRKLKIAAA